MPLARHRYTAGGPVLVRASTYPAASDGPGLPDPAAGLGESQRWLAQAWAFPGLAEAICLANPALATQVDGLVDASDGVAGRELGRAVSAVSFYLARWQRRVTPFGLFAGVGPVRVGPAHVRFGTQHRVVARADADWLAHVVDVLEQDWDLRARLVVVANNGVVVRGGRVFAACRPEPGQRAPGPVRETSTRYTRIVHAALAAAARPLAFTDLVQRLGDQLAVDTGKVATLLHGLVDGNFLLTNLRPPMTATDGLEHVVAVLGAARAGDVPTAVTVAAQLTHAHGLLSRHNGTVCPAAAAIRTALRGSMARVGPPVGHPLAVDVRLDADIGLPGEVLDEVARAAGLLVRLSTWPFGTQTWVDYQVRFRNRYGPGALVPVVDLVADSGLGYPPGYLGAPQTRPVWRTLTERDVHLGRLIQQALLDGADEILLSETDVDALTVGDHATAVAPARIELAVIVDASSTQALDEGDFSLRITGAPRTPTSMIGRFAHLLDPADRDQLTHTLAATATGTDEVVVVQLSFPPRRVHNQNVVRVGRLLPTVVSLAEYPAEGQTISLEDLAVTADANQLYLVHRSTGQRVVPYVAHALDVTVQTPPLARFIAEVADARNAVFGPFDLGAARTLPFTPRIRHGRTVLSPARWLLTSADLADGPRTGVERWEKRLHQWRQRWRVPARVIACHGEMRLPLDLDLAAERELLRTRLARASRLEVWEDVPEDRSAWLGRRAEFVIPLTLCTPTPRPLPHTTAPGATHRPGDAAVVHAQLVGNPARFDLLLTTQLPGFVDRLADLGVTCWWARRHRDLARPDADQYLAVFLRLADAAAYGEVAARLSGFTADLHGQGLPGVLTLATFHEHPARYGDGPAWTAAEQVFATDTLAAIAQLRMAEQTGIAPQALAAVSMAQLAAGFGPDPITGYQRLLRLLDRHSEPVTRTLSDITRSLADPDDAFRNLRSRAGGAEVVDAWTARASALREYHDRLLPQRDPAGVLRTLLHDHHVRAVGIDPDLERVTDHLARAAAMRGHASVGAR